MNRNRDQIAARVRLIVAGHMGRPAICVKDSDRLFEDIGIDWFDLQELILFISEAFGVDVAQVETGSVRRVSDLVEIALQPSKRSAAGKESAR